jgi:hypothetical protein
MRHDLDAALDQCLTWLGEGKDLKSCLDRYPEYAVELRPLLEVALDVARVRVPAASLEARAAGQRRMLAAMAQRQERWARAIPAVLFLKQTFGSILPGRPGSLRPAWQLAAVIFTVLLFAGGWLTVSASAGSLPGDALYPVKLASQKAQLALVFNPDRQRLLADQFETQKRQDVQAVLEGRRQVAVEFEGVLQQFDSALWVVGGLQVAVQQTTTISGKPDLGAKVHVQATLPGNGEVVATGLEVVSPGLPESTDAGEATATPGATDTAEPSATPEPSPTPEASATREATRTTAPTETPEAVQTPDPDGTAEHEGTEDLGQTSEPDDTPEPEGPPDETSTPVPDEPDEDDGTPDRTDTPDSDDEGERRQTPRPTETPDPDDSDDHDGTPGPTGEPDDSDEHNGTPDPTGEPDDSDEHNGTPDPTGEPDDSDEHDGSPDPTGGADDPGEHGGSPDSTGEPYNPGEHGGTPDPTTEPDD